MPSDEQGAPEARENLQRAVEQSPGSSRILEAWKVGFNQLEIHERGGPLKAQDGVDRCPDFRANLDPQAKIDFYLGVESGPNGEKKDKSMSVTAATLAAAARNPLEVGTLASGPSLSQDKFVLPLLRQNKQNEPQLVLVTVNFEEWLSLNGKANAWVESHPNFFPDKPPIPRTEASPSRSAILERILSLANVRETLGVNPQTVGEEGVRLGRDLSNQLLEKLQRGFDTARFGVGISPGGKGITSPERHTDYLSRLDSEAGINFDEYAQTQLIRNTLGLAGLAFKYLNAEGLTKTPEDRNKLLGIIERGFENPGSDVLRGLQKAALLLHREAQEEPMRGQEALFNQAVKSYLGSLVQLYESKF